MVTTPLTQTPSFALRLGLQEGGEILSGRAGWGTLAMGALPAAFPLICSEVHPQ